MRGILTTALALTIGLAVGAAAVPAPAAAEVAEVTAECKVLEISTWPDRVHVRCLVTNSSSYNKAPDYLAVNSHDPLADRLVILGSQALAHKLTLVVTFDYGTGDQPSGCNLDDCRRLLRVTLR